MAQLESNCRDCGGQIIGDDTIISPIACTICDVNRFSGYDLAFHNHYRHQCSNRILPPTPEHRCPLCSLSFASETDLYNHAVDHTFNEARELLGAIETANEAANPWVVEPPYVNPPRVTVYQCNICRRWYPTVRDRDFCQINHPEDRREPWLLHCAVCDKRFANQDDRDQCEALHRIAESKLNKQDEESLEFSRELSIRNARKEGL